MILQHAMLTHCSSNNEVACDDPALELEVLCTSILWPIRWIKQVVE